MNEQEIRDALAAALRVGEPWPGAPSPEVIADRILSAVRRVVAAELRAAAEQMPDPHAALWLNTRADALDPQ